MKFIDWDLVEYNEAVERQRQLVDVVSAGSDEAVVICRHPSTVTLGRGSKPEDVMGWTGAVSETSRGGRATYHGPGQIVVYPILDLKREHRFPSKDLHGYMRALETAVSLALQDIGIKNAEPRTVESAGLSVTGVWVDERKIASIGIAVRKWVTYHGCAINVENDPVAFTGIQPCGFQSSTMTSVEAILGSSQRPELKKALIRRIQTTFAGALVDWLSKIGINN